MYVAKYYVETENKSEQKSERTILKVRLRFKDEVAPKDRDSLKQRIFSVENGQLHRWLMENEGLQFSGWSGILPFYCAAVYSDSEQSSKKRRFNFTRPSDFGLNIKGISEGYTPLEEMLDLDSLNKHLLNGKSNSKY